jgi:hypothetical protein
MTEYLYKKGDRVRKKAHSGMSYTFGGSHRGYAEPGDIFIISDRGKSGSDSRQNIYNVEGSGEDKPNWLWMEKEFELVPFDKESLKKKGYKL